MGLDPTVKDELLAALLPESDDNPRRVALLRRLAGEDRTLGKTMSEAMSDLAVRMWKAGKQAAGDAMLAAAEAICPDRREACAQQRLDWLKKRLADMDYVSVARGLQAVNLDDFPPALRVDLAHICLDAAKGLAKADQPTAQRVLDRAFQLAPFEATTEPNSLLWIDLHPEKNDQKVARCKDFLTTYPRSDRADDVRKAILAVAQHWVDSSRRDEGIELALWLLDNTADSPLKQQIDKKIAAWKAGPNAQPEPAPVETADSQKQAELDSKLLVRKRTVSDPLELIGALMDKEVWIIEVSDEFEASQLSRRQTVTNLKNWVSKGGILWANNSMLGLFGIQYTVLREGKGLDCAPAGTHAVLEGVKTCASAMPRAKPTR